MRAAEAVRGFARCREGTVAILLALSLPALLGGMGLAVDFAAVTRQQAVVQSAADSAALNAARELIIAEPTITRVQAVAQRTVDAILAEKGKKADWTVSTSLVDANKSVVVKVTRPLKPMFQKVYAFLGVAPDPWVADMRATARLSHNSKLCLLLMGDNNTALALQKNARLTGAQCSIHSNSRSRDGILLAEGSRLTSDLVCSRGGIQNNGSTVLTDILNDCPPVVDPLRNRAEPASAPCTVPSRQVYISGTITLNPGTYCGGIEIKGTAKVTFNPGIYIFLNGDLNVWQDAEIRGQHVGLYFRGQSSYFRFRDNALVELTGPKDGPMSGILLWRDRTNNVADRMAGKMSSATNAINANRATKLTGTIYLPEGQLYIGAKAPVAQVSDYTVILARKLELFDGPNLVLNTNYAGSDVPVPQDLGPIGLKDLRLMN
jgi:Flp pilus assembly protein TadG